MPDIAEEIKTMLEEVMGQLETKTEDGKVIKLLDVFKMFPALQEKYATLETRIKELESQAKTRFSDGLPGLEQEKTKFSLYRALQAIKTGKWDKAQLENDVFRQTRAMATGSDSDGGYLVPYQAMPDFIELLRGETVCMPLGASVIDGLKGSPAVFTRQTGGATAYWVGENSPISETALTVGQLKMVPKKVAALVKLSNELIQDASPGAEAKVREDLVVAIALAIDLAALRGSGSENQPLGIANTAGINTVTMGTGNGAIPDWSNPWPDMRGKLAHSNALRGKLGFTFHPDIHTALLKQRNPYFSGDTGGEYPFMPVTPALMESFLGFPFKTTTEIPVNLVTGDSTNCSEIYFGNWAELLIGMWQNLEILSSNVAGTSFADDQTWVRVISRCDIALRHAESFCLCNTAKIT